MKPATVRTPIQKRFGDIDIFHHVNNVSQQSYFDLGKTDYFHSVLGKDLMEGEPLIITVSTSTSYMGQIRRDDAIEVITTVTKIGNKSITMFQQIVCVDEVPQREHFGHGRFRLPPPAVRSGSRDVALEDDERLKPNTTSTIPAKISAAATTFSRSSLS